MKCPTVLISMKSIKKNSDGYFIIDFFQIFFQFGEIVLIFDEGK